MKKNKQVNFKLSEEQLERLRSVAVELRLNPSQLVSSLIGDFITARQLHGARLIWPVEFAHFAAESKIINYPVANEPVQRVAEAGEEYNLDVFARLVDWIDHSPATPGIREFFAQANAAGFSGAVPLAQWLRGSANPSVQEHLLSIAQSAGFVANASNGVV